MAPSTATAPETKPSTSESDFMPSSSTSLIVPLLSPTSHVTYSSTRDSETAIPHERYDGKSIPNSVFLGQYKRPFYQDFVCGLGAALFETVITFPLNKLIFRQQLHGINLQQSIGQLRHEGIRFLYRGLLFPLMQKGASRSLMFGMYDGYRHILGCRHMHQDDDGSIGGKHTFTWCHSMAAFLAGATEATSLTPFERVQVLMQHARYHSEFRNSWEALKDGLRPYGLREYYRGYSVILLRNGSTNVLFFYLRLPLRDYIVGADRISIKDMGANRHVIADFCSGAVLGASLSTVFYPLNVIKARMQSRLGGNFEKPVDVLYKILQERAFSIRELYRGVALNFSRSLLTWGLTNAGYEILQRSIFGKGSHRNSS